jgi:pSer/pThr/pTyr-binding forkhead associated (FHA) protein
VDRQIKEKRELDKKEISIGRYAPNDIIIDSQLISRKKHACILWYNGGWLIKSNEETQKELIFQGQSIHQHVFTDGDRIYLAPSIGSKSVMLRFELLP